MHGALIGDIVGSRFEFDNHRSKDFELFTDACEATDDSVMSLAVAKAIVETARALPQERTGSRGPAFYGLLRQNAMGRQIHADLKWLENRSGRPVNAVAHCFCAF